MSSRSQPSIPALGDDCVLLASPHDRPVWDLEGCDKSARYGYAWIRGDTAFAAWSTDPWVAAELVRSVR